MSRDSRDKMKTAVTEYLAACLCASVVLAAGADPLTEHESLFFAGDTRETATAQLLRIPKEPPRIESSSQDVIYEAGRDYVWQTGSRAVTLTAKSRIPFKTTAELYPPANSPHSYRKRRDGEAWMFYGPGRVMHDAQCAASYASDDDWRAPAVEAAPDAQLGKLRERMKAKEALKLVMLGDSISTEADASALSKAEPNQPGYPTLAAQGIEARFGVKLTLVNISKGGMDTAWGVTRVADAIAENPDIFLVAFGMNDASGHRTTESFSDLTKQIFEPVRAALPDCAVILISPMTANSEWLHAAPETYPRYAAALGELTGPGVAFADVTTTWNAISDRKKHMDISGNGLNHPNDYGHRIYADVILKTIGTGN